MLNKFNKTDSRINEIEQEIFNLLRNRSKDLTESAMILTHLLFCNAEALKIDTDLFFKNLAKHYSKEYKKLKK